MKIEIVEYNPDWIKAFEKEKNNIIHLLGSHAAAIEHVGSTAIPNQESKPVIDIFIGVSPLMELPIYQTIFCSKEYSHTPIDMKDRYLFAKYTNGAWSHNLHILLYDEGFYMRKEFLFRDYLRKHSELVVEYGEVKKRAALKNCSTIEEYTRLKTAFIQKVFDAARAEKGLPSEDVWES